MYDLAHLTIFCLHFSLFVRAVPAQSLWSSMKWCITSRQTLSCKYTTQVAWERFMGKK